ncbi:hypothetical protein [Streptomyces sp. AC602_WCS936]|uniref:hypothetical protein n=1 Tax=Streptomyces sp. AC602_WCS936 TaxID=2823685 RepID=UPI001C2772B1|nr:hypothetical protein [Streptomyces sp. AC602_WCS936]
MSNGESTSALQGEPVFLIGTSGRLPLRTICALELDRTELSEYEMAWRSLLGDRLNATKPQLLPHPSRLVKLEPYSFMRRLTEALDNFPRLHVIHMPKQPAERVEHEIFRWACTLLGGRPYGNAVLHTGADTTGYHLTPEALCPTPDASPFGSPSGFELLGFPAKLAAYAAYQHRCYPNPSPRPFWLPSRMTWADPVFLTNNDTY